MAALARERAPRFMDADLDILVEEVENRREILYCRGPRKPFRTEMKYQWEEVARKINAQSDAPRTWSQCRKKFNDLTRVVKEKITRNRQQQKQSRGAPARGQRLSRLEERVLAIMRWDATPPVAASGLEIIDNDDAQDVPPGFSQADELQGSEEEDTQSLHLSLPSTSSDPGTSRSLEDSLEARSICGESLVMESKKLISATDIHHSGALLKSLNEQRVQGLFCDITIIVEDRKFRAHKNVLSSASSYFHQLFILDGTSNVNGQILELSFVRAEVFAEVLNFIYTSKLIRVNAELASELIQSGQALGLKFLADLGESLSKLKGLTPAVNSAASVTDSRAETSQKIAADATVEPECLIIHVEEGGLGPRITDAFSLHSAEFRDSNGNSNVSPSGEDSEDNDDVIFCSEISPPKQSCSVVSKSSMQTNIIVPNIPVSSDDVRTQTKHATLLPETEQNTMSTQQSTQTANVNYPQDGNHLVTEDKMAGIDTLAKGCRVYANIDTNPNTYHVVVPNKEDLTNREPKQNREPGSPDKNLLLIGDKVSDGGGHSSIQIVPENSSNHINNSRPMYINEQNFPDAKRMKREQDHYELVVDGRLFYVCIVCKRSYACLTSLRRHFNVHSWEKKYPCHYCEKVFPLAEYRTKHEILHTGERRYQCLTCGETFISYQVMASHIRSVHSKKTGKSAAEDETDSKLYRLLPCKTLQIRQYGFLTASASGAMAEINDDGIVYHVGDEDEGASQQTPETIGGGKPTSWDDIFPQEGTPVYRYNSLDGNSELEFVIPESFREMA
ncbi:transcriptional regulator Kaiso isoform X1 [Mobula birostris]|uniref:transcriptional regulator Kaiso isoform X1 n=2 Tax=Mobula birostris TaxID=1983395 RepID=UPI003B28692A